MRKPSIKEAVDWLLKALTVEYRRKCLEHWRGLYGDDYADKVEFGVKKKSAKS